ncbi:Cycloisomaltooligosaccharide glucanotransferase [Frondihabitans sp. 762G35]|uniref:CBM35 domain-containing protein n=1 Tax=Frondihabitans sp. 762G35 TaxID=1446794 RepID=UPI000D222240|nr:CBM35 domain-containing protein [Frondihabitans sp. 762G35]ARC58552.1 Cycloisomaltooligosaccharide glucanotransferase [Frondihabitans sp. 762G35]
MKRRNITLGLGTVAVVSAALLVPGLPAAADGTTLVVDAGSVLRPVTHVASGGLYALATTTTPDPTQLPPLHLNQLTQPAPGVQQLGNGATTPTGDALKVAPVAIASGAQETIRMPDIYPDFPYKWVSWNDYLTKVDTMVKARLAATSTTNINGWELWNEPDGTWDTTNAGPFNDGWVKIYNEVRSLDTVTPIVGPSYSQYNHDLMLAFLTNAKAKNAVPDVISWHELSQGWAGIGDHMADLRAIENSLGISPRPVSINEYAWTDQVDVPSASLHYISQFERYGIRDAERAYWYESGTVNGLLYNDKPTASYWMYKWYGDMTGNMVPVTASGDFDGIASLDSSRKIVTVVAGGVYGSNTVTVKGLGGFGSQATVTLTASGISGRTTNAGQPTPVLTTTVPIVNGTVSVPITNQDSRAAYEIVVTPASGPTTATQQVYEAENATVVNAQRLSAPTASNGGYVGRIDGTGDARTDSFVDFLVTAPTAGNYTVAVRYANGGSATATQGLAYNGGAWSTLSYPTTGSWGAFSNSVSTTVSLKAGSNVIRLAKGSPGFAGGSGYAELDSITLTHQ